ncbi:Cof-type HAD-IIB family hydrolase [Gottfriedia acidiceleris]|uniref:Cof-type HAD-IIB family hydrolase n=1 Tax=Gottfriedia acidiceleris TaxID=371036 RepID=UPI000B42E4C3|nr:Cof-type HAD-IIB family hydrolase [Gottfriedia acidiceleris]
MSFIAIDLDGTLLNNENEISEENINAIKFAGENGIEIVISTGRAYFDVQKICEGSKLSPYVIGTNGATIHSKSGECISSITISEMNVEQILKWLDDRNYYFEVFTDKSIYSLKDRRASFQNEINSLKRNDLNQEMKELVNVAERQFDQFGYVLVDQYHEILQRNEEVNNILVCTFDKEKLAEARNRFNKSNELTVVSSAEHNIEITSRFASKGLALEKLVFLLNGSLDQAMAIGDSNNDISMFEKVRYSVAMGNAKEDIKAICIQTTLNNNENGVAHAIYHYIDTFVVQR